MWASNEEIILEGLLSDAPKVTIGGMPYLGEFEDDIGSTLYSCTCENDATDCAGDYRCATPDEGCDFTSCTDIAEDCCAIEWAFESKSCSGGKWPKDVDVGTSACSDWDGTAFACCEPDYTALIIGIVVIVVVIIIIVVAIVLCCKYCAGCPCYKQPVAPTAAAPTAPAAVVQPVATAVAVPVAVPTAVPAA